MAAMMEEHGKVEKLTTDNYFTWKFNVKMMLIGKGLWEIVEGTEELSENSRPQEQNHFKKRENQALAMICLAVSVPLQIYVRNAKTGKEAWDSLSSRFEEKTLSRKILLRRKLYHTSMNNRNMVDHINDIRTIADQLEGLGDEVAQNDLVMVLLSSLPDEYNNLITTLETLEESRLTWEYVRDRLLTKYERRSVKQRDVNAALLTDATVYSESPNVGSRSGFGDNGREFRCHYCKGVCRTFQTGLSRETGIRFSTRGTQRERVEQRESASYCNCSNESPVSLAVFIQKMN